MSSLETFKAVRGEGAEGVLAPPPASGPRPKSSLPLQTSPLVMACRVSSRSFSAAEM